jgi:hypothetical protein
MQRNIALTLAPADAVVNNVSTVHAYGAAGPLTLDGAAMNAGMVTLDMPRRLAITSTGDESGKVFTVTGIARNGGVQTETLAGPAAGLSVNTAKDYASGPLAISINAASAGNIRVGTSQTLSSQWLVIDRYDSNGVGFDVDLGGAACTYSVESTIDEPFPSGNVNPPTDIYLIPRAHPNFDGHAISDQGAYTTPINAIRLTVLTFATGAQIKFRLAPGAVGGV